jgi:hypothetical protein
VQGVPTILILSAAAGDTPFGRSLTDYSPSFQAGGKAMLRQEKGGFFSLSRTSSIATRTTSDGNSARKAIDAALVQVQRLISPHFSPDCQLIAHRKQAHRNTSEEERIF